MPARSSSVRLISSQRSRTRPAVRASASPKTCGCLRTSLTWTARATSSRSPEPFSASATSDASSTVCGTIVRSVCSRSHGQSRRSRSVSVWSSTSASARLNLLRRCRRRARQRGAGIRVRLVADLVLDLRVAVVLLRVLDPLGHRVVLPLLPELLPDRGLHLAQRRRLRGLDVGKSLDDVIAVLRMDRRRELAFLERERGLVELRDSLSLDTVNLP